MQNLPPLQFQAMIVQNGVVLLDVRMPDEFDYAHLAGAVLIPLPDLPARFGELDAGAPVAIYCHHGVRSERAGRFLEARGFGTVAHLVGGIDAWSVEVDATIPRY